jgi:hypothetical protein
MKEMKEISTPISKTLVGISGEYFVAAELSRRGFMASITLRNTDSIDIHISKLDESKLLAIQVKTKQHRGNYWSLTEKAETLIAPNLYYIFVELTDLNVRPNYYIVPSKEVASYARKSHKDWLNKAGRNGKSHKDSSIRKFRDIEQKYKEQWEILK